MIRNGLMRWFPVLGTTISGWRLKSIWIQRGKKSNQMPPPPPDIPDAAIWLGERLVHNTQTLFCSKAELGKVRPAGHIRPVWDQSYMTRSTHPCSTVWPCLLCTCYTGHFGKIVNAVVVRKRKTVAHRRLWRTESSASSFSNPALCNHIVSVKVSEHENAWSN